jgi:hypothetical protein
VKTKVVILASFILVAVFSPIKAGPRVGVYARAGRAWCPPAKPFCPPVQNWCGPIIYRAWPVYYYPASYYGWGLSSVDFSTSFGNLSPAYDSGELGIYRVPAPLFPSASHRRFAGEHISLAALISPAEVRPSLEPERLQGGPPLFSGKMVRTLPDEADPALTNCPRKSN